MYRQYRCKRINTSQSTDKLTLHSAGPKYKHCQNRHQAITNTTIALHPVAVTLSKYSRQNAAENQTKRRLRRLDTYWWYVPSSWPFYVYDRLTARQCRQNMGFVNNNHDNTLKTLERSLYLTVAKTFKPVHKFFRMSIPRTFCLLAITVKTRIPSSYLLKIAASVITQIKAAVMSDTYRNHFKRSTLSRSAEMWQVAS